MSAQNSKRKLDNDAAESSSSSTPTDVNKKKQKEREKAAEEDTPIVRRPFIRSIKYRDDDHQCLLRRKEFAAFVSDDIAPPVAATTPTGDADDANNKKEKDAPIVLPVSRYVYPNSSTAATTASSSSSSSSSSSPSVLVGVEGDSVYFRNYGIRLVSYLGVFRDCQRSRFIRGRNAFDDVEWQPHSHWIDFDVVDASGVEWALRAEFSSDHYCAEYYGHALFGGMWNRETGECVAYINCDASGKWQEAWTNTEVGNMDEDTEFNLTLSCVPSSQTVKQFVQHTEVPATPSAAAAFTDAAAQTKEKKMPEHGANDDVVDDDVDPSLPTVHRITASYAALKQASYNRGKTVYVHTFTHNHQLEKALALVMNVRCVFKRASPIFSVNQPMDMRVQYRTQLLQRLFRGDANGDAAAHASSPLTNKLIGIHHTLSGVTSALHLIAEYAPADLPIATPDLSDTPTYFNDRRNAEEDLDEEGGDDEDGEEGDSDEEGGNDEDGDDE